MNYFRLQFYDQNEQGWFNLKVTVLCNKYVQKLYKLKSQQIVCRLFMEVLKILIKTKLPGSHIGNCIANS